MGKIKKFLIAILVLFVLFTQSISSHETQKSHEHIEEHEEPQEGQGDFEDTENPDDDDVETQEPLEDLEEEEFDGEGIEHMNPGDEDLSGNLLDEESDLLSSLGLDKKENLSKDEMKSVYEKLFYKREISDEGEREFYYKIINDVYESLPQEIPMAQVRNYFDLQYLMKFIDKYDLVGDDKNSANEVKDSL